MILLFCTVFVNPTKHVTQKLVTFISTFIVAALNTNSSSRLCFIMSSK
jgi:hypothetical protein